MNNNTKVKDINLKWSENSNNFFIPWYWNIKVDLQTISDDALVEIFNSEYIVHTNIPSKQSIIPSEFQTDYFKETMNLVWQRFQNWRFAILSWPTWTWKTTLARTLAYESWLEFYEEIWDQDKWINSFIEQIKTVSKWNIPQIKSVPGPLLKAISGGWIFCINEANFLENDVLIWLSNMVENGYVVFDWKKYKIHPNFYIIFTSNDWYIWTKDYNQAIKRKSWGVVFFEHEKDQKQETKILINIYNRKKTSIKSDNVLSDDDLENIANTVFTIRNELRDLSINNEKRFYSEDISFFWDFFYIRLYEKIIEDILTSKNTIIKLSDLINKNAWLLPKKVGDLFIWSQYIDPVENDFELYSNIMNKVCANKVISITKNTQSTEDLAFWDSFLDDLFEMEDTKTSETKTDTNIWKPNSWFNKNIFRRTLTNRLKTKGEEIKREEYIQELSNSFYECIIDSQRKKDIKIIWVKNSMLEIQIDWESMFLNSQDSETKNTLLSFWESDLDEFKKFVFWNPSVFFIISYDWDEQTTPNILTNSKNFEIRRRSKLIELKKENKDYVLLFWLKWNIKDIRYKWTESWKYYIPQTKASEVIFSVYEKINDIPETWHFFVYNWADLVIKTKSSYTKNDWIILKRIKQQEQTYIDFENDIKKRFANVDKLWLQNWWIEKSETSIPSPIVWTQYDIQSLVLDTIWRKLEHITTTTQNIIVDILNSFYAKRDILLTWESWTWKTSIAKEIAKILGLPYLSIQIPEDFKETDIKTRYHWNEWSVEETIQPFLNYYINGWIVELKEINMAYLSWFLNQYMDSDGTITFNWNQYKRNPNFLIISTRNPVNSIKYPWTKPLNLAFMARFKEIEVPILPKEEQLEIIKYYIDNYNKDLKNNLDQEQLNFLIDDILNICFSINNKIKELELTQDISTSEELKIYYNITLHIDKLIFLFKSSKNIDDIRKNLKSLLYISDEQSKILQWSNNSLYEKIISL